MRKNIVLIGLMGCGKSAVARGITISSHWPVTDTDKLIEKLQKKTITSIFESQGESFFRDLETQIIESLMLNVNHHIISTGGGIVLRETNRVLLKQLGWVVWLKAQKETILSRIGSDTTRPLLQGNDKDDRLAQLLKIREPFYQATADYELDTDSLTIHEISERLWRIFTNL